MWCRSWFPSHRTGWHFENLQRQIASGTGLAGSSPYGLDFLGGLAAAAGKGGLHSPVGVNVVFGTKLDSSLQRRESAPAYAQSFQCCFHVCFLSNTPEA